jgi:hypothetical protein
MNFLKRCLGRGCCHRFGWPRFDGHGRHYQSCLLCGTAYEYDWRMMRQTGRLLLAEVELGKAILAHTTAPTHERAVGVR